MWMRQLLEYIGGERDLPPLATSQILHSTWASAATWVIFLLLIYAFCGQSSRFIYIDF